MPPDSRPCLGYGGRHVHRNNDSQDSGKVIQITTQTPVQRTDEDRSIIKLHAMTVQTGHDFLIMRQHYSSCTLQIRNYMVGILFGGELSEPRSHC